MGEEITYREIDRNILAGVAEKVRDELGHRLGVSIAASGAIKIAGCPASIIVTATQDDWGREWHGFQISHGGQNGGAFAWDKITDAVAVILASGANKHRDAAAKRGIADWRIIAARLAARKAAQVSA